MISEYGTRLSAKVSNNIVNLTNIPNLREQIEHAHIPKRDVDLCIEGKDSLLLVCAVSTTMLVCRAVVWIRKPLPKVILRRYSVYWAICRQEQCEIVCMF